MGLGLVDDGLVDWDLYGVWFWHVDGNMLDNGVRYRFFHGIWDAFLHLIWDTLFDRDGQFFDHRDGNRLRNGNMDGVGLSNRDNYGVGDVYWSIFVHDDRVD